MSKKIRIGAIVIVALVVIAIGAYLLSPRETERGVQSTDDAYVQADFTAVSPQISGEISKVDVSDYQAVNAGDPLVSIDDRDLQLALKEAYANAKQAEADHLTLKQTLAKQSSRIDEAAAVVEIDKANMQLAESDFQRFENLARDGSGTRQNAQKASAHLDALKATLARDKAALSSARQQTKVLKAQLAAAAARLDHAKAAVANAELQLSYTLISAPTDGVVVQRRARVGGYAHTGQPLLTLVPLDKIYIQAHFRETQMTHMREGQPVTVTVDAFPGLELKGVVEHLGPASGVSFSPVAPHNATGNFTKIVQRLPVKIKLNASAEQLKKLKVGMSVEASVDVAQ